MRNQYFRNRADQIALTTPPPAEAENHYKYNAPPLDSHGLNQKYYHGYFHCLEAPYILHKYITRELIEPFCIYTEAYSTVYE